MTKKDLSVKYMGLELKNPLIASSSPLTAEIDKIKELEKAGIGAVVLKSIFEEQITGVTEMLNRYSDYPEAADYLRGYVGSGYVSRLTSLVETAKKQTSLPVIASINCAGEGKWIEYARTIEKAGADALELNIFFLPTSPSETSLSIEKRYMDIAEKVVETVSIPVSVKLSRKFTNILHITDGLYNRKVKGAVLYNRFYEPDIDLDTLEYIPGEGISSARELHNSLRDIAMVAAEVDGLDISVSTGVYEGRDAVKSILAGAKTVQLCSTLLKNGFGVIGEIKDFIGSFMERNTFGNVSDFCGLMNEKTRLDDEVLGRVQYMKYFPREK